MTEAVHVVTFSAARANHVGAFRRDKSTVSGAETSQLSNYLLFTIYRRSEDTLHDTVRSESDTSLAHVASSEHLRAAIPTVEM